MSRKKATISQFSAISTTNLTKQLISNKLGSKWASNLNIMPQRGGAEKIDIMSSLSSIFWRLVDILTCRHYVVLAFYNIDNMTLRQFLSSKICHFNIISFDIMSFDIFAFDNLPRYRHRNVAPIFLL
jgi:hypothetical protein